MTTEWAHLPNAKHIDWILADLETDTDKWAAAYNQSYAFIYNKTYLAAWADSTIDIHKCNDAIYAAIVKAVGDHNVNARYPAYYAILALIAYDCAYLLTQDTDHVIMLGLLGNDQALLLYPACSVDP